MICESASRRFQPGEGPSGNLLRDCENFADGLFEALLETESCLFPISWRWRSVLSPSGDYKGVLHHGHWRAGLVRRHGPSIKQESCRLLSPFGEKQQPGQHERTQSCKWQTVGMCDTSDF